jgi:hypothetical protein
MSNHTTNLELLETTADDIPSEVKRELIEQDMRMWLNTRWQAEMRRRVARRVADTEGEAAQIKLLERCEASLMALEEEREAL